jgi:hypothetical protein
MDNVQGVCHFNNKFRHNPPEFNETVPRFYSIVERYPNAAVFGEI